MPAMKAAGYGRIVNMGSVLGKSGGNPRPWLDPAEQARASNVAYGVPKAGIRAMPAHLAQELPAPGITIHTGAPRTVASAHPPTFHLALSALIPVWPLGRASENPTPILFTA